MGFSSSYDVIVVGAGHAGVEAALASSRVGAKTLLITNNLKRTAYMSCNPSIGGLGKGHLVKEIDALGGVMGLAADEACIQFKRLNQKKGPAVRGSRAQCDKDLYSSYVSNYVASQNSGLEVIEAEVQSLHLEKSSCDGVVLSDGSKILSKTVVITTGTFMKAVMHFGLERVEGGRIGDKATLGISDQLNEFGFSVKRLKTGTPPRLLNSSIDWSKTQAQGGDKEFIPFSFRGDGLLKLPQVECHLTYTNEKTHEIIRKNLDKSPMFTGAIEGIGPRYCPSIEDKITRFSDKDRHQTFLEPEGLSLNSIYLQGISTSLPQSVQQEFLETIPGLERVQILKPGYAVEYDFIEPSEIFHSLETKLIQNLFLAGQINGTSGYEEAAGQGLVAGTNAALKVKNLEPLVLQRDESYIGVLIDDLVIKGTKEPYRMMTSRAEHRLVLREDNVLERLCQKGRELGLLDDSSYEIFENLIAERETYYSQLSKKVFYPKQETNNLLAKIPSPVLVKPNTGKDIMRRTEINSSNISSLGIDVPERRSVWEPVEIRVKYEGYIGKQLDLIKQSQRLEGLKIPKSLDFRLVKGLSAEEVEKLTLIRPQTIGQATRISGVNPSAIQALLVNLKGSNRKLIEVEV